MNTENRLMALEEKILFQEDALQKLDAVVSRQYDLIDGLKLKIKNLEDKLFVLEEALHNQPASVADEKPPHY